MALKFIDISSYQSVQIAGSREVDGVIVKATQGVRYVNTKFSGQITTAKNANKLLGIYHYAEGGDPIKEADFFLAYFKPYLYKAVPVLDWEGYMNKSWGNKIWCRKFVNRFHARTGVWPLIYISASALHEAGDVYKDCGLWIAGYPVNKATWDVPAFPYKTDPWPTYVLWQYTSAGNLDRNTANVTAEGWMKIANPKSEKPKSTPKPKSSNKARYSTANKSLNRMADDSAKGLTGNGDDRKKNLGKYYDAVQTIINYNAKTISKDATIAALVKFTKSGVFGNGDERKDRLGGWYNGVQNAINAKATPSSRTYTVVKGDTLSGIGAKLGVSWSKLANKNGIKSPYNIYPGQKLKY